jgi:hypothetical protein
MAYETTFSSTTIGAAQPSRPALAPIYLPDLAPIPLFSRHEDGWSDQYGALHVASAYCGWELPSRYSLNGLWHHGCIGPWYNFDPGLLSSSAPGARARPLYTARCDQAKVLEQHGFAQVRPVGLPMVYAPETKVSRIAGSLLVVPTHTLTGDTFPDRSDFDRYADEIREISGRFTRVVVCVHPICRRNGLWVDEFSRRGFEIVYGAQNNDRNSLLRIRALFGHFESVTTNGWGSHVAYALALGNRVSIFGTEPRRRHEDFLRDAAWAANKAALDAVSSPEVKLEERAFLRSVLVHPAEARTDVELGRYLIGADHRISAEDMRALLAGFVKPLPAASAPLAHHHALWRAKLQASLTFLPRDPNRAARLMFEGLKLAEASGTPAVLLEALIEIPAQLSRFDPARGTSLLQLAVKLARDLNDKAAQERASRLLLRFGPTKSPLAR